MLKKIVIGSAILLSTSTGAFAHDGAYVGATVGVKTVTDTFTATRMAPGSILAGYSANVAPNVYLGGEVFADIGSIEISDSNTLRTTYGIGASVMPGIMIADHTMGYVKAGVLHSHFTSLNKNANGGQLGLGMQADINSCWAVRTEYDYTAYQKINKSGLGGFNPRGDEFKLGLIYKF